MRMLDKASIAGNEAVLVRVYGAKEQHPIWKRDGVHGDIVVELDETEAMIAEEILQQRIGKVILAFRSFLAQLGIDAGHEETTSMKIKRRILHINTLLTNVNGENGQKVLDVLSDLARHDGGVKPIVGRGLFLPDEALCSRDDVDFAKKIDACDWDPRGVLQEDGGIALPPLPVTYRMKKEAYDKAALEKVLRGGSGRAMLRQNRTKEEELPREIGTNDFFVGGFDLHIPGALHAVLRRRTEDGVGKELPVYHSGAVLLAAGRTDRMFGDRQTELVNVNGRPVATENVHVIADLYRASAVEAAGI